ncbi:MAG: hypothetical protein WCH84_07130 [Verrucomicrobiota bacterium]
MFAILTIAALTFSGSSTHGQSTVENQTGQTNVTLLGYAWVKKPISVPQKLTSPFKPLKHGEVYSSLGKTADGLVIVCELTTGKKALAIMAFKDTLGRQVVIRERENNKVALFHPILDSLDTAKLKPAELSLEAGHRYDVVGCGDGIFTLVFAAGDFRQPVEIVSTDVEYLSVSDLQKKKATVIAGLRETADQRLRELSNIHDGSSVTEVFLKYSGHLADETAYERTQLAQEYTEAIGKKREAVRINAQSELEAYETSQKAKGLIKSGDQWITPERALWEQQNITGAFGVNLGGKVNLSQYPVAASLEDGTPMYGINPPTPVQGLTRYYFLATPKTGIIYRLLAEGDCINSERCDDDQAMLAAALRKKYGETNGLNAVKHQVVERGNRKITCYCQAKSTSDHKLFWDWRVTLDYIDYDLERQAHKESIDITKQTEETHKGYLETEGKRLKGSGL